MTGATLCSGIRAPEVAAPDIDWRWAAEIEPFPKAVGAHYWPDVPDLGDITADDFIDRAKSYGPLDVLVAGTPCQAFSVAGLRGSLSDARGNLTLRLVEIVDALNVGTLLWENVPGVLSTKDNAFGCFLGALVGADAALEPVPFNPKSRFWKYDKKLERWYCRWSRIGVVSGPKRNIAWRIQDAQYHGLAQRRERVFLVASPRNRTHPAEVLFERSGVQRYSPPSRKAGQGFTHDLAPSLTSSGRGVERSGESRRQDPIVAVAFGGNNTAGPVDVDTAVNAKGGSGRMDFESETFVAYRTAGDGAVYEEGDITAPLTTATDPNANIVAFPCKDHGADATEDLSPTLRSMGHDGSHANGGGQVAIAFDTTQITSKANRSNPKPGDPCHPLAAGAHPPAIAFNLRGRDGGAQCEVDPDGLANIRAASGGSSRTYVGALVDAVRWAVRRLTPRECERLQGFPDDFTAIPGYDSRRTGKFGGNRGVADGPRYKALGNSMAVPVLRWLLNRIKETQPCV